MRILFTIILIVFSYVSISAQGCCAGGGGGSIAGGASTGVLKKFQLEVSGNYQHNYSDLYFSKDSDTLNLIDGLGSNYLFFRVDYGITDKFTLSIATGYFTDKTLTELGPGKIITSKGFSDLIVLPRYSILNKTRERSKTEVTVGLGLKLPLGSNTDSNLIGTYPGIGDVYAISPQTVQASTGSQDVMLNLFIYQGYQKRKLRFFANGLFIKTGYNSMGQQFGNYASLGLFVGKTVLKNVGLTAQIQGEVIGKMNLAETVSDIDIAVHSLDTESSGSKKVFFIPQISYSFKQLSVFGTTQIPIYQYLNGVQVGSMLQATAGLTYRFMVKKPDTTPAKTFELAPVLD